MTKILGTTDEITTCECCGKRGLKMTVILDRDGEIVHFGRDCAAAAMFGRKTRKRADQVGDLARAVQFARDNIGKMSADHIHNRLSVAGLANFYKGVVWNDAGRVEVGA